MRPSTGISPSFLKSARVGPWICGRLKPRPSPRTWWQISAEYPSFPQKWMDDRTRTLAAVWLLHHEKPQLLLIHLVDLDSEAHENAQFSREANAILERID